MLYRCAFILALVLGLGTIARAENPQEQNACYLDAQRFCPETIPDRERVLACLFRNKSRISSICRGAIERDVKVNSQGGFRPRQE